MARYIDVETALKIIDNYAKTVTADGIVVVKAIRDIVEIITPTADVVPKSEVDKMMIGKVNSLTAKFILEDHEARIKDLMAEHDSKLAREIFEEVNMQIIPYSTDIYIKGEELIIIPKSDYNAILTELKKKYTEGAPTPATTSKEKYFSPEDVSKMTHQEVREKYSAIRKSMERW